MDSQSINQVISYIEKNCQTTLTPKQIERLREMKHIGKYSICTIRLLYRIAIDNFVYPECPYCKKPIKSQDELTIDHIIPRSKGGGDDMENLQPMHKTCNSEKGCIMPEIQKCDEIPIKKHRKNRNESKHKEREIVKSRTPEELYTKCKKIDMARTHKCHAKSHLFGK